MIRYIRDAPLNTPDEVLDQVAAHVRAHLSAVASADDDPEVFADYVQITQEIIPYQCVRISGVLDAEPDASYLRDGYDPYEGVPDELRAEAG